MTDTLTVIKIWQSLEVAIDELHEVLKGKRIQRTAGII